MTQTSNRRQPSEEEKEAMRARLRESPHIWQSMGFLWRRIMRREQDGGGVDRDAVSTALAMGKLLEKDGHVPVPVEAVEFLQRYFDGRTPPKNGRPPMPLMRENIRDICRRDFENGTSIQELADLAAVSYETMRDWVQPRGKRGGKDGT